MAYSPKTEQLTVEEKRTLSQNAKRAIVRPALIKDVPAMAKVINDFAARQLMLPRSHYQIYGSLRDFQVAEVDEKVVGCGALQVVWSDLAEVRSLAVAEAYQRRGLGSMLVSALLKDARMLGLPRVFCLTYQENFFRGMGFHEIPRESLPHKIWGDCLNCPKYPDCDETAMSITLEQEEQA